MPAPQYAIVSYLAGPLEEFVSQLRQELCPENPALRPHLTHLTPRFLQCSEDEAFSTIAKICAGTDLAPFRISADDVRCFAPLTPTVYLAIKDGSRHLQYLHGLLNSGEWHLHPNDPLPFVPHITLAQLEDLSQVDVVVKRAAEGWSLYRGPRDVLLGEVTFVRESPPDGWLDLQTFALGE